MYRKDKKNPLISIVLSFYNEENNIKELHSRLQSTLLNLVKEKTIKGFEIIFVNDCSTDNSENLIKKLIKKYENIKLINTSRNFGADECRLLGLEYVSGDAIIVMDSDLQEPPEVLPDMINLWKSDFDAEVVYTTRIKREGEHFLKLLITKYGYKLIKKISNIELPENSGDFKLFSKIVKNHLIELKEKNPYFRGLVSFVGYKQIQYFYKRESRHDGRENTKFPVLSKRVLWGYMDRALIGYSDVPLKFIIFLGLLTFILAFFLSIFVLHEYITKNALAGWSSIILIFIIFISIQTLMIGILGLYIGNIYFETKKRPNVIVKNIFDKKNIN
jgi:glycosyltransferase involved in cell wall biosynthesis